MTRGSRAWIVLLLLLGAIGSSLLTLFFVTRVRAMTVIREFSHKTDRLNAEHHSRFPARPAVFGEPLEGNAWEVYRSGIPVWKDLGGLKIVATEHKIRLQQPVSMALLSMSPFLDGIRKAQRMKGWPPGLRFEGIENMGNLSAYLYYASDALEEEGRHEEALDLTILHAALAQDVRRHWGASRFFSSGSGLNTVIWKNILKSHRLRSDSIRIMMGRLEALDRTAPTANELLVFELLEIREIYFGRTMGERGSTSPTWRDFWSITLARTRALQAFDEEHDRLLRIPPGASVQRYPLQTVSTLSFDPAGQAERIGIELALDRKVNRFLRLALGIALCELEKGRPPDKLEDLVPDYFNSIPEGLKGVSYDRGKLTIDSDEWVIRKGD